MSCCGLSISFSSLWCCASEQFLSSEAVQQRNWNSFNLQSTSLLPFRSSWRSKILKTTHFLFSWWKRFSILLFQMNLCKQPRAWPKQCSSSLQLDWANYFVISKPTTYKIQNGKNNWLTYSRPHHSTFLSGPSSFGLIVHNSGVEERHQVAGQSDWVSFLVAWGKKGRTWLLLSSLCDHHSSCLLVDARCKYPMPAPSYFEQGTNLFLIAMKRQRDFGTILAFCSFCFHRDHQHHHLESEESTDGHQGEEKKIMEWVQI